MPILGSFGTANERAYGFGDSSFVSSLYLPPIITNNAEIIYDASNPESVRTTNTYGTLVYVYNPDSVIYGSYWFVALPSNSNVLAGDTIGNVNSGFGATVVAVNKNVSMTISGVTVVGDQVVIDNRNAAACPATASTYNVVPSSTTWYDISGNNRHATLGGTPTLLGTGPNQYFSLSSTNTLTVPRAVNYNWNLFFVGDIPYNAISSSYWGSARFLQDYSFEFEGKNIGSGSGVRYNDGYSNGLKLWHGAFAGTPSTLTVTTRQGGSTGYYQESRAAYGNANYDINSSMFIQGGTIKFMAIYGTTSPTTEQMYNALKGRFGL